MPQTGAALVAELTTVRRPPLVHELRLRLADELVPTWQRLEAAAGRSVPPPYWAFLWPGSHALARLVLDQPELVADKRVLDVGAGGGLAGIATAWVGARSVTANDVDPLAASAQVLNAELNGVAIDCRLGDLSAGVRVQPEVVLVGDVWYERDLAHRLTPWLRRLAGAGAEVLIADPGRAYAPRAGLEPLATYRVPTTRELERGDELVTLVARLSAET